MSTASPSPTRRSITPPPNVTNEIKPRALFGKLLDTPPSAGVLITEVILLPLFFLACGYFIAPEDPLWVRAEFPWTWISAIVIALRHGALAGMGSSAILLAGWFVLHRHQWNDFPQLYFLGGFITVLLVGEFSSLWRSRTRRAELTQHYLDQRLETLVRQYYLLRLSHDRLEQELIGRPMSMRDALHSLKTGRSLKEAPSHLLQLLSQYCQVTEASLHLVRDGKLVDEEIARIGHAKTLQPNDKLVMQALATGEICHIGEAKELMSDTAYLVVAPLLDPIGDPYALLLVEKMPFYALQEENLQVIGLLLSYYSENLTREKIASSLQHNYPECPEDFAVEMERLVHLQKTGRMNSIIVALRFSQEATKKQIPLQIMRMKRQLDEHWLINPSNKDEKLLAVLMPLGNASTADGFLDRISQWLNILPGKSLSDHGIYPHVILLEKQSSDDLIKQIYGILNV